ncbi:hypothetical protein PMM47T1_21758 [Pseudomonas sp. M47T1]|nr:hypothetical protein PMM47T1_21758 [Pseudomonas sp. M47T1]
MLMSSILIVTAEIDDVMADQINNTTPNQGPLVLEARGSFFVGGRPVEQTFVELGSQRPADRVTVDQMYVEYMIPPVKAHSSIVMVHGAGLSGNSFDTTPDGRMGWYEYFVRRSFPVYVVDQVGRGRSGFNQAIFNAVGAGEETSDQQPRVTRMGDRFAAWVNFRFGPEEGTPYPDSQYPVEAVQSFSKQGIPDLSAGLPSPNPNFSALSTLASTLSGAILLGHSQSGAYPLEAALLDPSSVKAMILVEPGSCSADRWTSSQIDTLASIPLLVVYGDHLEAPTYISGPGWQDRFDECLRLIDRLRRAGGVADMLHPPSLGIRGNSHMLMQDRNNLEIADLILAWIDRNVSEQDSVRD